MTNAFETNIRVGYDQLGANRRFSGVSRYWPTGAHVELLVERRVIRSKLGCAVSWTGGGPAEKRISGINATSGRSHIAKPVD